MRRIECDERWIETMLLAVRVALVPTTEVPASFEDDLLVAKRILEQAPSVPEPTLSDIIEVLRSIETTLYDGVCRCDGDPFDD